jgi:hypothetical protein
MRRTLTRPILCLLALTAVDCTSVQPRGRFTAITTRAKALPMTIVQEGATGKTCTPPHQLDAAVNAALANAPGANALVNVDFRVKGACLEARGTAVRVAAQASEDP